MVETDDLSTKTAQQHKKVMNLRENLKTHDSFRNTLSAFVTLLYFNAFLGFSSYTSEDMKFGHSREKRRTVEKIWESREPQQLKTWRSPLKPPKFNQFKSIIEYLKNTDLENFISLFHFLFKHQLRQ